MIKPFFIHRLYLPGLSSSTCTLPFSILSNPFTLPLTSRLFYPLQLLASLCHVYISQRFGCFLSYSSPFFLQFIFLPSWHQSSPIMQHHSAKCGSFLRVSELSKWLAERTRTWISRAHVFHNILWTGFSPRLRHLVPPHLHLLQSWSSW